MCTIGTLRLAADEYVLFKNKDFILPRYSDRLVLERDLFGPRGLETFAEDETVESVFSGLSVGANRHGLFACDNNVKITDEHHQNYDRLVETALRKATSVADAIAAITDAVAAQPSWWGNLILADPQHLAAVEVRGREVRVEHATSRIFRTNHQPLFGETGSPEDLPCSARRFASARSRLGDLRSIDDVKAMLASHDDGETGICNHGVPLTTVYSYVLHRQGDETTLHVAHGRPCEATWSDLPVPLGARWTATSRAEFESGYPGGFAA